MEKKSESGPGPNLQKFSSKSDPNNGRKLYPIGYGTESTDDTICTEINNGKSGKTPKGQFFKCKQTSCKCSSIPENDDTLSSKTKEQHGLIYDIHGVPTFLSSIETVCSLYFHNSINSITSINSPFNFQTKPDKIRTNPLLHTDSIKFDQYYNDDINSTNSTSSQYPSTSYFSNSISDADAILTGFSEEHDDELIDLTWSDKFGEFMVDVNLSAEVYSIFHGGLTEKCFSESKSSVDIFGICNSENENVDTFHLDIYFNCRHAAIAFLLYHIT